MSMRNELLCPKTMGPLTYEQIQALVDNNKIESYKRILERVATTSISSGNMSPFHNFFIHHPHTQTHHRHHLKQ